MQCACSAHAVRMQCACSAHAENLQYSVLAVYVHWLHAQDCFTVAEVGEDGIGRVEGEVEDGVRRCEQCYLYPEAAAAQLTGHAAGPKTQPTPSASAAQAADSLAEAVAAPHLGATPGPFWRWLSLLGAIVPTPKTLVDPGAIIGASLYTAPCRHGDPAARRQLIETLDGVRERLSVLRLDAGLKPLTPSRTEGLYVYYPNGGFYRRHVDAAPKGLGYSSEARAFSYLLYLNEGWREEDGGCLRLFTGGSGGSGGSGGREEATLLVRRARSFLQVRRAGIRYLMDTSCKKSPRHDAASFVDVEPRAGTLVVFSSDEIEHEVLDTFAPRLVLAGWWHSDSRGARFRRVLSRVLILVGLRR